jgi:hypothetical protein
VKIRAMAGAIVPGDRKREFTARQTGFRRPDEASSSTSLDLG